MKEIILNNNIIAYSYNFNPSYTKEKIISNVNKIINEMRHVKADGYVFKTYEKEFDDIYKFSLSKCVELCEQNQINFENCGLYKWINILRNNPVQRMELDIENKEPTYHNHYTLSLYGNRPNPLYSIVYYLQMPDNLSNIDGYILFKDNDNNVLKYLPSENELLIFDSKLSHAPIHAKNSTKNRIVLAADFVIMDSKSKKTLI